MHMPNPKPYPHPYPKPKPEPRPKPKPEPHPNQLGYNFIALASALTAHLSADYQNNIAKGQAKAKAS